MKLARTYPLRLVCRLLGVSRSSIYYKAAAVPDADAMLKAAVLDLAGQWPTYGYRRLTHNHAFPRYPNLVADLQITRPNQVWVADITYIRLRRDFVYLAVLMDVFTRQTRAWHLSRNLDQGLTLGALERALVLGVPQIHHSDQGVQYAAGGYIDALGAAGVRVSMAAVGRPTQNAFAERFMRTLKEEEVYLNDYADFAEAKARIGRFIEEVYMTKRVHSSLGYLTPVEFEAAHAAARW